MKQRNQREWNKKANEGNVKGREWEGKKRGRERRRKGSLMGNNRVRRLGKRKAG